MEKHDIKNAQGGFTLIEIIAVLVILGILAAVAVPKFVDLQKEARAKSLQGAVAAAQSQVSMQYARELLSTGDEETAWTNVQNNATNICTTVKTDGFDGLSWTCTGSVSAITIKADAGGESANGTFTRP